MGEDVQWTDDNCPLLMSYDIKGVFNLNRVGWNLHRRLLLREHEILTVWKAKLFGSSLPPVM